MDVIDLTGSVDSADESDAVQPPLGTQDGYIYGFKLPFTVNDDNYCVVKIGSTSVGQLGNRLRLHYTQFHSATGVPIWVPNITVIGRGRNDEDIITDVQNNRDTTIFLISRVNEGLRAAEYGARECIGVAPFNIVPTFKAVFPNRRKITTTEWVVAKAKDVETIKVEFWHGRMNTFQSADSFLDRLRRLNERRYDELRISLETLDNEIYRTTVHAPLHLTLNESSTVTVWHPDYEPSAAGPTPQ